MKAERKPRGDAVLKTLPSERQALIAEHARSHTLAETVAWLKEDGLRVSQDTVSKFLSWYLLREQFRQDEETTETLLEQLKEEAPELSDEQLDELGQRTFSLLAVRRQDAETFLAVRSAKFKAELEKQKLSLRRQTEARQERALQFEINKHLDLAAEKMLDAALRKQAEEIATSGMTQKDQIAAMRKAAFSDVDALQQSGKVVIPK